MCLGLFQTIREFSFWLFKCPSHCVWSLSKTPALTTLLPCPLRGLPLPFMEGNDSRPVGWVLVSVLSIYSARMNRITDGFE